MTATATMPRPATTPVAHAARSAGSHAPRSSTAGSGQAQQASFAQLLRAQDDDTAAAPGSTAPAAPGAPTTDTEAASARVSERERDRERKPATDDPAATPAQAAAPTDPANPLPAPGSAWALAGRSAAEGQAAAATDGEGDTTPSDPLAALRDAMGQGLAVARKHGQGADRKPGAAAQAGAADVTAGTDPTDTSARSKAAGFGQALAEAAGDTATKAAANQAPVEAAAPAADGALPSLGATTDPTRSLHTATAAEAPAPAQASLPASPGTPAFAPALGAQLSTWLKDGVQHASLELNPQDLGPIDVRIAVKDGQTHVDLSADVASTRQALVDAMPQLSAALGDVGLSLTGGGVADPSAQGQQGGNANAEASRSTGRSTARTAGMDSADAATRPPATARQHRGLLDLYA